MHDVTSVLTHIRILLNAANEAADAAERQRIIDEINDIIGQAIDDMQTDKRRLQ